MTDIFHARLAPSPDAVESAVGDETVILHMKSGTYFGLDAIGTRIWTMLKEGVAPASICETLCGEFAVDGLVVEADVRQLIGDLKAHDILVET